MSYTPHTWVTGETITPERLNNIETGIASAGGEVHYYDYKCDDINWTDHKLPNLNDIVADLQNGVQVYIRVLTASTGYEENNNYSKVASWTESDSDITVSYYNTSNQYFEQMTATKT